MREIKSSFFSFFMLVTLCLLFYSWAMNRLSVEEETLLAKCAKLESDVTLLEKENILLKEKLSSLSDPSGEEYMLRKELGLCPKNSITISFKHDVL